jgi:hypothetical protein
MYTEIKIRKHQKPQRPNAVKSQISMHNDLEVLAPYPSALCRIVNTSTRGGSATSTTHPVEGVEHSKEYRTWSRNLLMVEGRNRRNRRDSRDRRDRRNMQLAHSRRGEMNRRWLWRGIVEARSRLADQVIDLRHGQVVINPVARVGGGLSPAMGAGVEMLDLA